MLALDTLLFSLALVAIATWGGLSLHIILIERRREEARHVVGVALDLLESDAVRVLSLWEQVGRLRQLVKRASRELIMRAAAERGTPQNAFTAFYGYITERWGADSLVEDASAHKTARDKWRRITALRILVRAEHPEAIRLLGLAVGQADADIASVALSLLGPSTDPAAVDILLDALRNQRQPASRVAIHLDESPIPIADRLLALLPDANPVVRLWAATLLAKYPVEAVEQALAPLTVDPDPRVRKAAVQSLGTIGGTLAAECAERLLTDPLPYVRAHAARALGDLNRVDFAEQVVALLGDTDWWVRLAAKESLELMGPDVWPVLMRSLNHEDRFVRNGAAEVFQNLGVLDSLIVMEAASDNPAPTKIDMLRRIAAAGGVRFTDSLVERAGPVVGARITHLLASIGLRHVGAA